MTSSLNIHALSHGLFYRTFIVSAHQALNSSSEVLSYGHAMQHHILDNQMFLQP